LGFPSQHWIQCKIKDWQNRIKKSIHDDRGNGFPETFSEDCEGFANAKECDEFRNNARKTCQELYEERDFSGQIMKRGFDIPPSG
jgi:hypothetical protein